MKEKEAYFKKTMIVEVRDLAKKKGEPISANEIILNQSKSNKKNQITSKKKNSK